MICKSSTVKSARALLLIAALQGCGERETGVGPVSEKQSVIESRVKKVLVQDGLRFRDLNGDGTLNPYEDWRLPAGDRADDLIGRMTVAEKAGTMMHSTLPGIKGDVGTSSEGYDLDKVRSLLNSRHVTSYITRLALSPDRLAAENNKVQQLAEATRLGIPITISTDPRHHFQYVLGASARGEGFSLWPEPLGFAALRDPDQVRAFGDIARRDYRAVGIHMALSPQADLATEPRWPRQVATFGSRAELVSTLAGAYVAGFQGSDSGLSRDGVVTVVKHWVGYGAAVDGFDAHNFYGRYARLDGDAMDAHIAAFSGALGARSGGVMPTYSILVGPELDGESLEQVGAGYSGQLLSNLLRGKHNYDGIILSDWAITRDCTEACRDPKEPQGVDAIATSWGVASLSRSERYIKGIKAGLDQFGGEDNIDDLVAAIDNQQLSEERINESVRRILLPKFKQGLFENPYVDPARAPELVRADNAFARARRIQGEAQVLLENRDDLLPVAVDKRRVFLFGMDPKAAIDAGLEPVEDLENADFAIIRAEAPSELLHPNHFFGSRQHEGRLDYRDGDKAYEALKEASAKVPAVFSIFLNRPAILSNIRDKASVILGNFGASDAAVLDVILGKTLARGKLPFELPSSMQAVENQDPGLPDDSAEPLYPFGYGLLPDSIAEKNSSRVKQ